MSDVLTAIDRFLDRFFAAITRFILRIFSGHKQQPGGVIPQKTLFVDTYPSRPTTTLVIEPFEPLKIPAPSLTSFEAALGRILEQRIPADVIKKIDFNELFKQIYMLTGFNGESPIITDWSGSHPDHVTSAVLVKQLSFLLEQAPMMDVAQFTDFGRLQASRAPYAYIHPITFAQITNGRVPVKGLTTVIPKSPTQWVVTSLMPAGRVIFTPNVMPGLEKNLAK